jgi:hypothetical protein
MVDGPPNPTIPNLAMRWTKAGAGCTCRRSRGARDGSRPLVNGGGFTMENGGLTVENGKLNTIHGI